MANDLSSTMTSRSLHAVRIELAFLFENSVINAKQLKSILEQLPQPSPLPELFDEVDGRAAVTRQQPQQQRSPLPSSVPSQPSPVQYTPPTTQMSNASLNEKTPLHNQYVSPPPQPPPAYPQVPQILSLASALYVYTPTDEGDLALQPNDRIQVVEHMNDDWWRGRNERTGMEGIFPRSYVNVINEKGAMAPPPPPTSYGNLPLEVSQSGSGANDPSDPAQKSKFEQGGKKFGKKLGNAAIFGAGATVGSNIVNSIF